MDSVIAGAELAVEYPNRGGLPAQAPVSLPAGSWAVRAVHASPFADTAVGVVHLVRL